MGYCFGHLAVCVAPVAKMSVFLNQSCLRSPVSSPSDYDTAPDVVEPVDTSPKVSLTR